MPDGFPILYPFVKSVREPHTRAQGQFIGSRPLGITVHYTADRNVERAIAADDARDLGYHLLIERDGTVIQTAYLDRRVNHAGEAMWQELSPNRHFAAIALICYGELKNGKAWNGSDDISPVKRPYNLNTKFSNWDDTTQEQQTKLLEMLRWFIACGVDPKNICGHDECALPPGRKVDPGGSLPWTMAEVRRMLVGNLA